MHGTACLFVCFLFLALVLPCELHCRPMYQGGWVWIVPTPAPRLYMAELPPAAPGCCTHSPLSPSPQAQRRLDRPVPSSRSYIRLPSPGGRPTCPGEGQSRPPGHQSTPTQGLQHVPTLCISLDSIPFPLPRVCIFCHFGDGNRSPTPSNGYNGRLLTGFDHDHSRGPHGSTVRFKRTRTNHRNAVKMARRIDWVGSGARGRGVCWSSGSWEPRSVWVGSR